MATRRWTWRVLVPVGLALAALALVLPTAAVSATARPMALTRSDAAPPPIKHVWYIELENEESSQSFGDPSLDPYLATTLPSMGAFLTNYFAVGHDSLDNYIAQISGQAPDPQTMNDCGRWSPFEPTGHVEPPFGQFVGHGCVYPAAAQTIGNQLTAAHLSWSAYMQDMGNDPARDHTTMTSQGPACGHPAVHSIDDTEGAVPSDQYATRHEGFMYFHSVIDNQAYCDQHVVSFQPLLRDLATVKRTPNFSWISPNLCNDGHDAPCVNGDPGGLTQADAFLRLWIPQIVASPAYKANGLIIITFDEGSTDTACCGEMLGRSADHPNTAKSGRGGPGGGDVGAVLLSPFITPGTVSTVDYNHYSTLRSLEDIFGLSHLGDAAMPQVLPFGPDVYTTPDPATTTP